MNQKTVKKLKRFSKRNWLEYVSAVEGWPYMARLRLAWYFISPIKEIIKKWSKKK